MLQSLNLDAALPELILSIGAMALLMLGVFTRRERGELILWLAVLAPRRGWPFRGDLLRHHDAVRRQLHRRSLRAHV